MAAFQVTLLTFLCVILPPEFLPPLAVVESIYIGYLVITRTAHPVAGSPGSRCG